MVKSQKKRIKIGFLPITDHLILGVSCHLDNKNFTGFAIEPVRFNSWDELSAAILRGEVEGAFAMAPLAMKLSSDHSLDLRAVLLGHREGLGLVVGQDIQSLSDLRGKTIGIPATVSTHHILLKDYLRKEGFDPEMIKVAVVPPPDFIEKLKCGEIDGYFGSEPFGSQAEDRSAGRVLLLSKDIRSNHIDCVLVFRRSWIEENDVAVSALIESLVAAGQFIHSNPYVASDIGAEFLGQSRQVLQKVLATKRGRVTTWDLMPLENEFSHLTQVGESLGILKHCVDAKDFVDDRFAKHAYAKIADKRIRLNTTLNVLKRFLLPTCAIVLVVLVWELLVRGDFVSERLLPAPSSVFAALQEVWVSGILLTNTIASLSRVFVGFLIASVCAVPLGLLIGRQRYLYMTVNPIVQMIRTVSPISWIPLAILWFGVGDKPAVFIIFITAFFPILLSTMLAVKTVDPVLLRVASNFGANNRQITVKVILPAILPFVVIGLRIGLGISWVIVVAAEMVGMNSGLGYMILDARNFLRTDLVVAGMVVIGVIGFALDVILGWAERSIKRAWNIE